MTKHVMYLNKKPEPITLDFPESVYTALNQETPDSSPFHNCIIEMYPETEDVCIDSIQESPHGTMVYHVSTTNYVNANGMLTDKPPQKQKIYIVQDFEMDRIKVFLNKKQAQQFSKTCIEQLVEPVLEIEDGGEFHPIHEM